MNPSKIFEKPHSLALMLIDLQNDFIHPEGAYGRAGQKSETIAQLPSRLTPLADVIRKKGRSCFKCSRMKGSSFFPGTSVNCVETIQPPFLRITSASGVNLEGNWAIVSDFCPALP